MIRLVYVLFLSLLFTSIVAQQTFYTHIHDENEHRPFDMLIKTDGNMLFCSFYKSDDTSWSSVWELDLAGEIINEWTFTNTTNDYFKAICIIEFDNQIFLFGEGQTSSNGNVEEFVSMRKFDMHLNEIENYCYYLSGISHQSLAPIRVIYRDSAFHIFTTVQYELGWFTPAYFKVSQTGTIMHSAFLPPSSGQVLSPHDFCLLPGSDNLFTVVLDGLTLFNTFGVVTEFDSEMNIVSQIPLLTNSGPSMPDFGIMGSSDTSFYTMYNKVHYNTHFNSVVETRDLAGNTLNQFTYECPEDSASWIAYRNALDVLPDGNLIFCTTKNIDFYPGVQLEPTQIRLFKLTPDLDLIWQKYLFGDDGNYRVWSVKAHQDGGIVVLGTFSRTPPLSGAMEIFFMKTDSEGLLTGLEDEQQKIKITEAIIFPNPASEIVNIEFSQVYQDAVFQLLDIGGKLLFEKSLSSNYQSVDISAIPAGTYVYRIFNKEGLDERGKVVVE